ncbi:MAG: ABC-F type ribosomal protection protein [Bdellovibrionales bacterium]|nr:ABC-F type ribosomal protection protein [Bdellovibrionales bacterium]
MLLVKGDKITFKYESQTHELLTGVSFSVDNHSRIGVVGKNGSGKSTLLKILLGELRPITGHLQASSELSVGYLRQVQPQDEGLTVLNYVWSTRPKLQAIKKTLLVAESNPEHQDWSVFAEYEESGGYDFEVSIEKNLAQLGLDSSFLQRNVQSLSGGEKTKVGLLRILVTNPSLLLLDEPTNNLDMDSIEWLKGYLEATSLPFILVSHDRRLLNESVSEIWEIEKGELKIYSGDYNFFNKAKDQKYKSDLEQFKQQQNKIGQLQSAASVRRVDAHRMQNFKPTRSIKNNGGLCKKDEGSGSAQANPAKQMRAAKAVEKRIQLMIDREEAKKPWIEKKRKMDLPVINPCKSKTVVKVKELSLYYDNKILFSNVTFAVERGQRLAIVGSNGSGKTSLIQTLNSEIQHDGGDYKWSPTVEKSVFYQENTDLRDDMTVLDSVWNPEVVEQSVARTILGSLGIGENLIGRKIAQLSPGEKVKVALAKSVLSGANTLVLDEPTNHLEIQGREMLEGALQDYGGTLIFASHDVSFIEKVSTRVFDLSLNQEFDSFEEWYDVKNFT